MVVAAHGCLPAASSPPPPALAGVHKELRFAKGASSTTVQEAVIRGERDRYLVGAAKGQYLSVTVEALEDNAVVDVLYPGANDSDEENIKGIALPGAKEIKSGVVQLPVDGKYMIVVGGTRGNASYKLTVAITREKPTTTAQSAPSPVPTNQRLQDDLATGSQGVRSAPQQAGKPPVASQVLIATGGEPKQWLNQRVRENAKFSGYIDNPADPKVIFSFSNGHLEFKYPNSVVPIASGRAEIFTSPEATCTGIEVDDKIGAAVDPMGRKWAKPPKSGYFACIAVRAINKEVLVSGRWLPFNAVPGEVYLETNSEVQGKSQYFKAQLSKP
jgi:hypothetical protein